MGRQRKTSGHPEPKTCVSCGRRMEYRKRWAKSWEQVKYCSDACRRRGVRPQDEALEEIILRLLGDRPATATLCPSEVARAYRPEEWRPLMEPVRRAARRLVDQETVTILQKGRPVDPSTARGPIRIGRGRRWSSAQISTRTGTPGGSPRS